MYNQMQKHEMTKPFTLEKMEQSQSIKYSEFRYEKNMIDVIYSSLNHLFTLEVNDLKISL